MKAEVLMDNDPPSSLLNGACLQESYGPPNLKILWSTCNLHCSTDAPQNNISCSTINRERNYYGYHLCPYRKKVSPSIEQYTVETSFTVRL